MEIVKEKVTLDFKNSEGVGSIKIIERNDGILKVIGQGIVTGEEAEAANKIYIEYSKKQNKKILVMIDEKDITRPNPDFRRVMLESSKEESIIEKLALINSSFVMRSIKKLICFIIHPSTDIKYFENEDSAVKWLKQ